jgi:hypothetical protein
MSRYILTIIGLLTALPVSASAQKGVIARCGASKGTAYYFDDKASHWIDDGIRTGQIVLVKLGEEWDIQFDDVAGASGYREDGARVIALGSTNEMLTIGAFRGNYTDIYTFNFADKEVVWSSHKIGTLVRKAAIYRADCS